MNIQVRIHALLYAVFFTVLLPCGYQSFAQISMSSIEDSLARYKQADDFIGYFEFLKNKETRWRKNGEHDLIQKVSPYYEQYLPSDAPEQRERYRYYQMHHGHQLYRTTTPKIALPHYLSAHEMSENPLLPDKLSYYVENLLGHIYLQLGQSDKAVYFYNITENSLRNLIPLAGEKEEDRLTNNYLRLQSSLAHAFKMQGDLSRAISIYRNMLDVAINKNITQSIYVHSSNLAKTYLNKGLIDSAEHFSQMAKTVCRQI